MFHYRCFFYFFTISISLQDLRSWTIAVKLCHMIDICLNFITQVQKFGGPALKNVGGKNMQNLGRFHTTSDFDRKCLRNETRYPKSERYVIENNSSRVQRKSGELWSNIHKVGLKLTFSGDFWPIWGAGPWKFTCVRDSPRLGSTHHKPGWLKIQHVHAYNFGISGINLTQLYQATWCEVGVTRCVQLWQGAPNKIWEGKKSKIPRDFWQLSTLSANNSGVDRRNTIWKASDQFTTTTTPTLGVKNLVKPKVIGVHVDLPNWTFIGRLYFGP